MDLKVSAQRLCLLLSWQEALHRAPRDEAFAGLLYQKRATRAITALRSEAETAIREAGTQLQSLIAADENSPDIARLQHRIQQINHLMKAEQASALGGSIAMTLEGYADAFGTKRNAAFSFTRLERQDFITIGVSIILMLTICLGLGWYHLWRANTTFTVERAGKDHLALKMSNGGQNPAVFVGSWSVSAESSASPTTYGVKLFCKPQGGDAFQPSTSIGDVWIYQNEVMAPKRKIMVEPGATITVLLDIRALESAYGSPLAAIRLECGRSGRRPQAVFTEVVEMQGD